MSSRAPNINRSRVHEEMVQRLAVQKLPGTDRTLFPTLRELLCFAALLGYSENRRIPLDREKGVEDISYQQFERGDAEDLIYLIALAETKDPEILKDGEEGRCAEIFEEFANGGLQIIHEALVSGGNEYPDRHILEFLKERNYLNADDQEPDVSEITF
jgi:dnd system-associated protein 4